MPAHKKILACTTKIFREVAYLSRYPIDTSEYAPILGREKIFLIDTTK
jgi:hypothetical protein